MHRIEADSAPPRGTRGWRALLLGLGTLAAMLGLIGALAAPAAPFPPGPLPGYEATTRVAEAWVLDSDRGLLGVRPSSLVEAYYVAPDRSFVHLLAFRLPEGTSLEEFGARYRLLEVGPGVPCAPAASLSGATLCTDISSHGPGGVAVLAGRGQTFLAVLTHDPQTPVEDAVAYARRSLEALPAP